MENIKDEKYVGNWVINGFSDFILKPNSLGPVTFNFKDKSHSLVSKIRMAIIPRDTKFSVGVLVSQASNTSVPMIQGTISLSTATGEIRELRAVGSTTTTAFNLDFFQSCDTFLNLFEDDVVNVRFNLTITGTVVTKDKSGNSTDKNEIIQEVANFFLGND